LAGLFAPARTYRDRSRPTTYQRQQAIALASRTLGIPSNAIPLRTSLFTPCKDTPCCFYPSDPSRPTHDRPLHAPAPPSDEIYALSIFKEGGPAFVSAAQLAAREAAGMKGGERARDLVSPL
jgi:hypothetical protein